MEAVNRTIELSDIAQSPRQKVDTEPSVPEFTRVEEASTGQRELVPDYRIAQVRFNTYGEQLRHTPQSEMAGWIVQILEVESPIHVDELVRRIRIGAGFGRAGRLIREAVDDAIEHGKRAKKFERDGDFIWRLGRHPVEVRNRRNFDQQSKKIEFVHWLEIEAAILHVVERSVSIDAKTLIQATLQLLGFERATDDVKAPVHAVIDELISRGRILDEYGVVRARPTSGSR